MDMLEPMRPLVSARQGRLEEVYFGFKKVEEVMNSYTDIRSGIDTWFELVGSSEERPRGVPLQQKRLRSIGTALSQYRF